MLPRVITAITLRVLPYLLVLPLVLLVASSPSQAEVVEDLYSAEVPVADHSEAALTAAARQALGRVLVKVSGSVDVLENQAVAAQLPRARQYVQQYAYSRDQDASGELAARFEFAESVITRMLTDSGAPLWTANRPAVVVWLTTQGATGRRFVTGEDAPELLAAIRAGFDERGIPVRFPLHDLQDAGALHIDDAWRLRASPIYSASQRYNAQDILVGRFTGLSSGQWVGDWSYLSESNREDRSVTAGTIDTFLAEGVSLVAEQMAGRYAVAATVGDSGGIVMSVSGVRSFSDYARIVDWLESLELVSHANVESIRGEQITLRLTARADAEQLRPIIELNNALVPRVVVGGTQELSYLWRN